MTIYQMFDGDIYSVRNPWDLLDSVRTFLDDNRDWGGVVNFLYYDGNIYCGWHNLGMKIPHETLMSYFNLPEDKTYRLQFYVNSRVSDNQVGLKGLYNSDVASIWQKEKPLSNQALEIIEKFTDKIEKEWNDNFMTCRRARYFKVCCDKKDCQHYGLNGCLDNSIRISNNGCDNYMKNLKGGEK